MTYYQPNFVCSFILLFFIFNVILSNRANAYYYDPCSKVSCFAIMSYSNPNALHFKIRPKDIDSGVVQSPAVKQARFKVSPDVIYVRQIAGAPFCLKVLSKKRGYHALSECPRRRRR